MAVRHKCFISYHHADQYYVDEFIKEFDYKKDIFICRCLGEMPDDIINSNDTDYVMRRIREDYIKDSTVTIVMMGSCTWARKYVDWEIQASLSNPNPNGLVGIFLPTFKEYPNRFEKNFFYAETLIYPVKAKELEDAIDNAFNKRNDDNYLDLIDNPRDRFSYNRPCG